MKVIVKSPSGNGKGENMKFEVEFRNAVHMPSKRIGLGHLDRARHETGVSNLDVNRVHLFMADYVVTPTIELSEDTARQAGHFQQNSFVKIQCHHYHLNQFVSDVITETRDDTTGELVLVKFKYQLDKQAALDAWCDAGFPLVWE